MKKEFVIFGSIFTALVIAVVFFIVIHKKKLKKTADAAKVKFDADNTVSVRGSASQAVSLAPLPQFNSSNFEATPEAPPLAPSQQIANAVAELINSIPSTGDVSKYTSAAAQYGIVSGLPGSLSIEATPSLNGMSSLYFQLRGNLIDATGNTLKALNKSAESDRIYNELNTIRNSQNIINFTGDVDNVLKAYADALKESIWQTEQAMFDYSDANEFKFYRDKYPGVADYQRMTQDAHDPSTYIINRLKDPSFLTEKRLTYVWWGKFLPYAIYFIPALKSRIQGEALAISGMIPKLSFLKVTLEPSPDPLQVRRIKAFTKALLDYSKAFVDFHNYRHTPPSPDVVGVITQGIFKVVGSIVPVFGQVMGIFSNLQAASA